MDGITEFDMKFKRSLIEQLVKLNTILEHTNEHLEKIAEELSFRNDMEYPKTRSKDDNF